MDIGLTEEEQNMTLELANIAAGAATSTLATLVDSNIEIADPTLSEFTSIQDVLADATLLPASSVLAVVHFEGEFNTTWAYVIDLLSAQAMAATIMGEPVDAAAATLSDTQLSALGEVFSQISTGAASALSQSLGRAISAAMPDVQLFSAETLATSFPESAADALAHLKFQVSGSALLPACEFIQLIPMTGLQQLIQAALSAAPQSLDEPVLAGVGASVGGGMNGDDPVTVQPVMFPSFDQHVSAYGGINKNLELVMDVGLNLTVELGRTEVPIKEVLELTRGSVVELNRIAGEAVDLYANGKLIAKGEVVVIEDNFGLRITSIVSPAERLKSL